MAMACPAIYRWTLVGLVGAFLDLVIAYCLLCAAAIAFMVSKFLGIFGFRLRCFCSGVFGVDSSRILCLQRLLAEYPTEKVSNVQLSVRSKFPFNDFGWAKESISDTKFRLTGSKDMDVVEFEGEGSGGSLLSDARKPNSIVSVFSGREGRFDLKGKGIMHQRSRSKLRRRQKGGFGFGKSLSAASLQVQGGGVSSSPSSNKGRNQWAEDDMELQQYGRDRHQFNYTEETPPILQWGHRSSNGLELREFTDSGDEQVQELKGNGQLGLDLSTEAENTIILLEQALREEHAARADLYLELEKERSAAASAADEAMAMIQRLQEEKAAVEMEARQYQRMIEEKSAYDAEEMNILKEIIVRRETEKHFLEKQLEAYRESSNIGNEHSSGGGADLQPCFDYSSNTDDDPVHLLYQLSSNFDKKVMLETQKQDSVMSGDEGEIQFASAKEILSQKSDDEFREFQDKLISVDSNSYADVGSLQNSEYFYQSLTGDNSEDKSQEEATILASASPYSDVFLNQRKHDSDLGTQTSCNVQEKEIELDFVSEKTSEFLGNSSAPSEPPAVRRASISNNCRITCSSDREVNIERSGLDITRRLPPICPKGKSTVSELLQKSFSGIDNERWRIDHEVGWLQERLREIQERREKLNISMVHREKDNMQFMLLENIANQLQEIRQLTEPKKAARQSSLPPPSSKGISKKRRCRSVTLSLQAGS